MKIGIVGGGLVGGLAAVSLARTLSDHYNVSIDVFEKFPQPLSNDLSYQEQYNARNLVLSSASAAFFRQTGLWHDLEQLLVPIETLKITRLSGFGHSTIDALQEGVDALGYVADMGLLACQVVKSAESEHNVRYFFDANMTGIFPRQAGYRLQVSQPEMIEDYDLIIVADGQQSWVCNALGIGSESRSYDQHALVTNITLNQPVPPVAYEQFIPGGALTLLPLTQSGFSQRMALVWIDREEKLRELEKLSHEHFLQILSQNLKLDSEYISKGISQIYPLNYQMRDERTRPHLIVIGNAAQSLHPVAAQGFNLAVRDIRDFIKMLLSRKSAGFDKELFSGEWMNEFAHLRQSDVVKVRGFVNTLTKVFFKSSAMPLRGAFQDFALAGFELLPGAKRVLSQLAMGGQKNKTALYKERGF